MATLSGTVLSNCSYIPSFIPAGTSMTFENASAPTSWTKDTTHNNKALRIVNGTVAPGGSQSFTTVFGLVAASPATVPSVQTGFSIFPASASITTGSTPVTFSYSGAVSDLPAHAHPVTISNPNLRRTGAVTGFQSLAQINLGSTGGNVQHTHTGGTYSHNHTVDSTHSHGVSETSHTHPFTADQTNYSVYYRDIIIANKQ